MTIALGSDHAGFSYKQRLLLQLRDLGHDVIDFGTHDPNPCDYPLFVRPAAEAVARGTAERGIVLGGSGNGEAMAANKVKGVRCGLCWNEESARLTRQHNDANVLALGERMIDWETAWAIVTIFLSTPFEGGRHERRIRMLD